MGAPPVTAQTRRLGAAWVRSVCLTDPDRVNPVIDKYCKVVRSPWVTTKKVGLELGRSRVQRLSDHVSSKYIQLAPQVDLCET
jgi:hypothetical protein